MSAGHDPAEAIGQVTHYFSHRSVAAVRLSAPLALGDKIHIRAFEHARQAGRGPAGPNDRHELVAIEGHQSRSNHLVDPTTGSTL